MHDPETLPWVAEQIRGWFPELSGRSIPVTWGEITGDIKSLSLPIAFVAPARQTFTHNGGTRASAIERLTIEFWLDPKRIKRDDGTETPFWSYYGFNAFRDRLFTLFAGERAPGGKKITFESMEVEADEFAVVIAFQMQASYELCPDDGPEFDECGKPIPPTDGLPIQISLKIGAVPLENPNAPQPKERPCP